MFVTIFWKARGRKMKIFSWVHKTFHHNSAHKDGFGSSNVKKAEPYVMKWDNNNHQASVKEVAFADVAGGLKDGFLTIGTLGCYGPFNFKSSDRHKYYLALESDEDEAEKHGDDDPKNKYFDSDEHEEMKPLLIGTKFENKFEHVVNEKPNVANVDKVEAQMTTPTPTLVSDDDDDVVECIDVRTDQKEKKECKRITLADLFLADSEKIMKYDEAAKILLLDDDQKSGDKQIIKAKHGQPTFAKKLISRVTKDNPHPIGSIRKLMKKMIKKKIHPDVDVKNEKSDEEKPTASEICENQRIEGTSA